MNCRNPSETRPSVMAVDTIVNKLVTTQPNPLSSFGKVTDLLSVSLTNSKECSPETFLFVVDSIEKAFNYEMQLKIAVNGMVVRFVMLVREGKI